MAGLLFMVLSLDVNAMIIWWQNKIVQLSQATIAIS
jgi:hypothetical protein